MINGCHIAALRSECKSFLLSLISPAVSAAGPALPSVAELESEGVCLLTQREDAIASMQKQHTFLLTNAPSLLVKDVPELLRLYKELVLQYTALSLAVTHHHELHASTSSHDPLQSLPRLNVPHAQSDHAALPASAFQPDNAQQAQRQQSSSAPAQSSSRAGGASDAAQAKPSSPASDRSRQLPVSPKQQQSSPLGRAKSHAADTGMLQAPRLHQSGISNTSSSSNILEPSSKQAAAPAAEEAAPANLVEQQPGVSLANALEDLQPLQPKELHAGTEASTPASGLDDLAATAQPMSFFHSQAGPKQSRDSSGGAAASLDHPQPTDASAAPSDHATHESEEGRYETASLAAMTSDSTSAAPAAALLGNMNSHPSSGAQSSHDGDAESIQSLPLSKTQGQAVLHPASPVLGGKGTDADEVSSSPKALSNSSKGSEDVQDDMFSGLSLAQQLAPPQQSGSFKA